MVIDGILKKSQFIYYSEGGATGCGGEIVIVQENGDVYEGNYEHGELSINKIIEAFPYIGSKKFDEIVKNGISNDGKIRYYYLECGNHLFVRDTVYKDFQELMKKHNNCDIVNYASWYDMVNIVCPNKPDIV
jgi:hypothetical protein